jgi:hypothetical protein
LKMRSYYPEAWRQPKKGKEKLKRRRPQKGFRRGPARKVDVYW